MASTPNASESFFIGNLAYPPLALTSSPDASFNLFIGNLYYPALSLTSSPVASYNIFTNTLTTAPPPAGTGIVLYPISEDYTQRPPLRY